MKYFLAVIITMGLILFLILDAITRTLRGIMDVPFFIWCDLKGSFRTYIKFMREILK